MIAGDTAFLKPINCILDINFVRTNYNPRETTYINENFNIPDTITRISIYNNDRNLYYGIGTFSMGIIEDIIDTNRRKVMKF